MPVGRLVLNRNPDNFFAETEQVAFCVAHVVPGIDFSNDPLLAGRIHSYVDTQISRLGGANFHEIPINAPVAPVHNNQRDGMHRQAIHRGRVSYEPNSLGGGCPFQAGARPASCRSPSHGRPATTRCAARPNGSPSTTTRRGSSGTASRRSSGSTSSTRSASSCRRCRSRRSARAWCRGCATSTTNWPRQWPAASAWTTCRRRCPRRRPGDVRPEVEHVAGVVAAGAPRADRHRRPAASPSSSPTAVTARPRRRWPNASRRRAPSRDSSDHASAPWRRRPARRWRSTPASRTRRRCCSTPWCCLAATRRSPRSAATGARSSS